MGELALVDKKAAAYIIKNADDFVTLEKRAITAKKLGSKAGVMLETGGMDVLLVTEKHAPSIVNKALTYGKSGVILLAKTGSDAFVTEVRWAKMATNGRIWSHAANAVNMLPLPVALVVMAYMFLVLGKMWFLRPHADFRGNWYVARP
jgi:hypothetical protein